MLFIRPKLFLTFLMFCLTPLALLALINYWNGVRTTEAALGRDLQDELRETTSNVSDLLRQHENELIMLGQSRSVRDFVPVASRHNPDLPALPARNPPTQTKTLTRGLPSPADLKVSVASLLSGPSHFASITFFDRNRHPLFYAEQGTDKQAGELLIFRTEDFLPGQVQPDERVWTARAPTLLRSSVASASLGASLLYTVSVFTEEQESGLPQGALVAELKLNSLLAQAAKGWELSSSGDASNRMKPISRMVIALDLSGRILYHSNDALIHQLVSNSMPYFLPVANRMILGEMGRQSFTSSSGEEYWAAYTTIPALDVSVAIARNYTQVMADSRSAGRTGLMLSFALAVAAAIALTFYSQRKTLRIERVTEGVVAIAQGKLDQRIEVQSSDEIRLLADNVNLMSERLREQIALEAEARQVQSFVKLSAMLTHDLKNAIGGLSLIVGNMEQHFNNQEFRADAMNALTGATEKLKALVERLSNPVTTLSGEFKRPKPTDLIPILKRVISLTAELLRGKHQIETRLPQSLFALVDGERVEKVVENLVLNALEAMVGKSGTLTVAAGKAENGEVFFSVTDTGVGMSPRFIEERLFRPFATTKKKGVGLGLYSCREVARANGGRIEVDSREGAGTTFRVMLPSAPIAERG